jgi:energy-coupling factor transporter ATP-binding protein EcfA2
MDNRPDDATGATVGSGPDIGGLFAAGERFPGTGVTTSDRDSTADVRAVVLAAEALRRELAAITLPFDLPEVEELREERRRLLSRFDAYVLPRLRRMDAPLLVVIGGSTGAGKSTLTNSLVGLQISPTGVLRPTTRSPVLVHHPDDMAAFQSRRILPKLSRRTMSGTLSLEDEATRQPASGSILLVPHEAVPQGLAVIDSPDLDSHVAANRELAAQLFEVADLWVFVTTGTDYADMVPWELLAQAVEREVSVAVVLDRMRESEIAAVRVHFATMLRDRGLAEAPLFAIPDTTLIGGMLPYKLISPLHRWLTGQATDVVTRDGHVGRAVRGALDLTLDAVPRFVSAVADQAMASRGARADLDAAFNASLTDINRALVAGSLIDPTIRTWWQEVTGVEGEPGAEAGRLRRRMQVALRGSSRYQSIADSVSAAVVRVLVDGVDSAMRGAARGWAERSEVASALGRNPELARRSRDFTARANAAVRAWQQEIFVDLDRATGRGRAAAEPAAAALMCLTVATGSDPVVPLVQRMLLSELPTVDPETQLRRVREYLYRKVRELLAVERSRIEEMLDEAAGEAADTSGLTRAAARLAEALAATGIGPAEPAPAAGPA